MKKNQIPTISPRGSPQSSRVSIHSSSWIAVKVTARPFVSAAAWLCRRRNAVNSWASGLVVTKARRSAPAASSSGAVSTAPDRTASALKVPLMREPLTISTRSTWPEST
jgi:hypothetical protein